MYCSPSADHAGVPNPQLIEEDPCLAVMYNNRSVAEQNSFDLSFNLLMDERFKDLRAVLFAGPAEIARFRQLVINSVMATDLGDKELKKLRNVRWERAFKTQDSARSTLGGAALASLHSSTSSLAKLSSSSSSKQTEDMDTTAAREAVNRKATIVIEHLIQASDVSVCFCDSWSFCSDFDSALLFLTLSILATSFFHSILCNTGMCTPSGMDDCFKNCTTPG